MALTTEQRQLDRREFLGGSDIPIIFGKSKFKSPFELLLEKSSHKEMKQTSSVYSIMGSVLEKRVQNDNKIKNVDEIEYELNIEGVPFRCHIDGLDNELEYKMYEIKVVRSNLIESKETYFYQMQTYMMITGKSVCELVLLQVEGNLKKLRNEIINRHNLGWIHEISCDNLIIEIENEITNRTHTMNFTYDHLEVPKCDKTIKEIKKNSKIFWEYKEKAEKISYQKIYALRKKFYNDLGLNELDYREKDIEL